MGCVSSILQIDFLFTQTGLNEQIRFQERVKEFFQRISNHLLSGYIAISESPRMIGRYTGLRRSLKLGARASWLDDKSRLSRVFIRRDKLWAKVYYASNPCVYAD